MWNEIIGWLEFVLIILLVFQVGLVSRRLGEAMKKLESKDKDEKHGL